MNMRTVVCCASRAVLKWWSSGGSSLVFDPPNSVVSTLSATAQEQPLEFDADGMHNNAQHVSSTCDRPNNRTTHTDTAHSTQHAAQMFAPNTYLPIYATLFAHCPTLPWQASTKMVSLMSAPTGSFMPLQTTVTRGTSAVLSATCLAGLMVLPTLAQNQMYCRSETVSVAGVRIFLCS